MQKYAHSLVYFLLSNVYSNMLSHSKERPRWVEVNFKTKNLILSFHFIIYYLRKKMILTLIQVLM